MAKQIVILGGGFAGVDCARALEKRLPGDCELTLFSRENHLLFTPLLGDVVGGAINPIHIVWPVRQMVRRAACRTAEATSVDLQKREVLYRMADGRVASQPFDHLVLACGLVVKLDIIPGMAAHGWPLKTLGDAIALRNRVIQQLEKAEVESDPERRRRHLTFAVVGGGFSGVDVCAGITDLLAASLRYYRRLRREDIQVSLLQDKKVILPGIPEPLSAFALRKMRARGIDVRLESGAAAVTDRGVHLKGGELVEAGTVVCTIGNTVTPLVAASGFPLQQNQIKTRPDMQVEGHPNVWAVGDCAAIMNAYNDKICPPTGQFAVRQAKQVAANILRTLRPEATLPFHYKPQGMFASIGHRKAVGEAFGFKFSGFPAWFLWRGIYLSKMPTFARKLQIAFDWAWQLFFPRDIVQLNLKETERLARAHFEPGQFVFRKGDPGNTFYIIERGRASVFADEASPPIASLSAGDHFGEISILESSRRSSSIRAEEPLDLITIDEKSFGQLVRNLEGLRTQMRESVQRIKASREFMSQAKDHPKLRSLCAMNVMSRPVATLPVALTFHEAVRRAQDESKGGYPVVDAQGRMVGICTRTDFYRALRELKPPETPLREIMHAPVITVRSSDPLTQVAGTFVREPIKRLVVVADDDPDRPVGMLTPFDILSVISDAPSTSSPAPPRDGGP